MGLAAAHVCDIGPNRAEGRLLFRKYWLQDVASTS
jgi:hypothetical protein